MVCIVVVFIKDRIFLWVMLEEGVKIDEVVAGGYTFEVRTKVYRSSNGVEKYFLDQQAYLIGIDPNEASLTKDDVDSVPMALNPVIVSQNVTYVSTDYVDRAHSGLIASLERSPEWHIPRRASDRHAYREDSKAA